MNDEAEILVDNARGDSVTTKRLTQLEAGFGTPDYLSENPIISYLSEGEQPHHILFNYQKGISVDSQSIKPNGNFLTLFLVTDLRIILLHGSKTGDKGESVPFPDVNAVESSNGITKNKIVVETEDHTIEMYINGKIDFGEIEIAENYIREQSEKPRDEVSDVEYSKVEDIPNIREFANAAEGVSSDKSFSERVGEIRKERAGQGSDAEEAKSLSEAWKSAQKEEYESKESQKYQGLDYEPNGNSVTEDNYKKIEGLLDDGEKVHYITQGSTIDVEGSSAGSSLWGDDRSRKVGTRGYVRAVVTDKRVAVKIPQFLGTDERSIPYQNITSVDLDTGIVTKRISLQTPGQTYHIEADLPGKYEVRQAISYIREKMNEYQVVGKAGNASGSVDEMEKLSKLKDLKEEGVLTDAEFEDKKSEILDQI